MFKHLVSIFLIFFSFYGYAGENGLSHSVLVTVSPFKFFVEKIAGNSVKVEVLVPPGASSHTYEPAPKQVLAAGNTDIWFRIGEPFETRVLDSFKAHNKRLQIVDLRQGLDMINYGKNDDHKHCCHTSGQDLHIWLSPQMAKIEAQTIHQALVKTYPEHKELYDNNLKDFLQELDELNRYITVKLSNLKTRLILVSHPAYAYFCRDYNLVQLSIEFEGRDPTPKQLTEVMAKARQARIDKVFIQMQYPSKGARLIAKEIGARVIELDPYSEHYMDSMRRIADSIASP